MTASVLLIDDHPLFRRGLRQLINDSADIQVCGEAGDGQSGLDMVHKLDPDLILLDLNMKGMDGLDTLKAIRREGITTRTIILTVSDHREDIAALFRAGADGYLLKDMEPEDLIQKVQESIYGKVIVDDRLAGVLATVLRPENSPLTPLETLTARERSILDLIADGLSNKLIAQSLGITEGTVKVHVKNLLKKLDVRSRLEAAVWLMNQTKP